MCRLVALLAHEPVSLAAILTRPTTGLVRQSFASRERAQAGAGGPQQAYEQGCLNGDGYGLGWYVPETVVENGDQTAVPIPVDVTESMEISQFMPNSSVNPDAVEQNKPAVFTSMKPAWNDRNLLSLAEKVDSPLIFAHVRAAGPSLPVSDATCHPFRAGRLLFMHNGMLAGFLQLQPSLVQELCAHPTAFRVATEHGLIDSAVAFAFLLVELGLGSADDQEVSLRDFKPDEILKALARTVDHLCKAALKAGIEEEGLLNFVVSDGHCIVACRYAWAGSSKVQKKIDVEKVTKCEGENIDPPGASLYFTTGTQWAPSAGDPEGMFRMQQSDRRSRMAILSSEPLTGVKDEWLPVPKSTFIVCTRAFDPDTSTRASPTVDVLLVPFKKILAAEHVCPIRSLTCPAKVQGDGSRDHVVDDFGGVSPQTPGGIGTRRRSSSKTSAIGFGIPPPPVAHSTPRVKGTVDKHVNVIATEFSGIGESPVLCIQMVPPFGVLIVGSQDGGLRFFNVVDQRSTPEIRHHSGPVLSLLASKGPELSMTRHSSTSTFWQSPASPSVSRKVSPKNSPQDSPAGSPHQSPVCSPRSPTLQKLPCPQEIPTPTMLLFSGGTNELRVWDISCCSESASPQWDEVVCLFCFKFSPNLGRVLSLSGDSDLLFVGFQSSRICTLALSSFWNELFSMKSKSRSIRFLTFDLSRTKRCFSSQSSGCLGPSSRRFDHHRMLSEFRGPHLGSIDAMAYHARSETLASAGSDGMLVFWSEQETCGENTPSTKSRSSGGWSATAKYCEGRPIYALAIDEIAEELFTGNATGHIRVWGIKGAAGGAGRKSAFGPPLEAGILALQLIHRDLVGTRQYRWLLSGDTAGRVCIWDVSHRALLQQLEGVNLNCCGALSNLDELSEDAPMITACGGTLLGAHIFGGDARGSLQILKLHQGKLYRDNASIPHMFEGRDEQALMINLLNQFVAMKSYCGRHDDMRRAASWLQELFERMLGANVRICGDGTVLARCGEANQPLTVLYSHYDVVPPGGGWDTDPWKLTCKDGRLIGRGTTDCKGPVLAQIFAARRLLKGKLMADTEDDYFLSGLEEVPLPANLPQSVNLLFVVDSAEESGSPGLLSAIQEASEQGWLTTSDGSPPIGLLVTNSTWIDDEHPGICYGMRGLIDLAVRVSGPCRDVHTGRAGLVSEPFFDLSALLASLVDSSGHVVVPGFDEKVRNLRDEDRQNLSRVTECVGPVQLSCLLKSSCGLPSDDLSSNCSNPCTLGTDMLKRAWFSPALSIISVESGTSNCCGRLIPKEATAVISIRTVPDQEASDMTSAIRSHLHHEFAKRRTTNKLVIEERCGFKWWEGSAAGLESSQLFRAARRGVQKAWGLGSEDDVLAVQEGGTMPMLPALQEVLCCDAVQIPLGQASDAAHLPNERISEQNLFRGVDTIWHTLLNLLNVAPKQSSFRQQRPAELLKTHLSTLKNGKSRGAFHCLGCDSVESSFEADPEASSAFSPRVAWLTGSKLRVDVNNFAS